LEDCQLIREEHLQRIINLLRASYTHIILDLSKSFSPVDITAMRMADNILLVAQLDLSSLRNVVRMMLTLNADEELGNKVHIILNRVGMETDITLKKAEEIIGKPIYWQIPNDSKTMMESRNAGVPLIQHAPKCKAQQSIQGLADAIGGKKIETQETPAKKGWLSSVFSGS
jgi:pilus assembly protein CpaE